MRDSQPDFARAGKPMNAAESISETLTEPTALATHLGIQTAPYLGVLTPPDFDGSQTEIAPRAEIAALLSGAAVHDLGWLRRIALNGEDRFRWLSGMVTNSVESLPDHTGAYNLVLNAQGRIQGDLQVWKSGETLELEIHTDQTAALLAHFDRFIIMDDVELTTLKEKSALGLTGPLADQLLAKLGLSALPEDFTSAHGELNGIAIQIERGFSPLVPHYAVWATAEKIPDLWQAIVAAGASPVGSRAIETLRIAEGIPAYGIDIQSRDLVQETAQMRAVSFTKGCYLGQEIVERVRSRGQVHRHLRALEIFPEDGSQLPAIGAELRAANAEPEAKPAGNLTSITTLQLGGKNRVFGIGMIRAEAEVGSRPLSYAGGTATILHSAPKSLLSESNPC
jgi:folate-binding protein YgfZ